MADNQNLHGKLFLFGKIQNNFDTPLDINGYNVLKFDFIYNQENMSCGSFKTKLFTNEGPQKDTDIELSKSEDLGNGYRKAQAVIKFNSVNVKVASITLGIVGCNTDYKGQIYIDNITSTNTILPVNNTV